MFEPQQHLIKLPRKVKDRDGRYTTVYDDYLEVKWRLVWFREKFPHGSIDTQELCVDLDRGYARYRAVVDDGEGGRATGHGTESAADFTDYCERAETRALGRALAGLGVGTAFVGQDLTEGDHVADAPVATAGMPNCPTTSGVSNGRVPEVLTGRPTEADITALTTLAVVECSEEPEVFAQRLRTMMRLKPTASVAPKLLTRTMTMAQYRDVLGYYQRLKAQLDRPNVSPEEHGDGTTAPTIPVAEPAQRPTAEAPPASPPRPAHPAMAMAPKTLRAMRHPSKSRA